MPTLTAADLAALNAGKAISLSPPAVAVQPSPDKATVTTVGPILTDANGHTWAINAAKQVVVDKTADTSTANVVELAYVSGKIWHGNTDVPQQWYSKTLPTDKWSGGVSVNPLTGVAPPVAKGTRAAILAAIATAGLAGQCFSGQHAEIWTSDSNSTATAMVNIEALHAQSGQYPAILGLVLNFATNSYATSLANTQALAKAWWAKGGIVQLSLYSNIPTASGEQQPAGVSISAEAWMAIATPGTPEYLQWHKQLTKYWAEIKTICAGGNTVLWRPFIELNGGWNWYGAEDGALFQAVWKDMWNSAQAAGVNDSLIWGYSINSRSGNYLTGYPGSKFVDTIGFDTYDIPSKFLADANVDEMLTQVLALNKPLLLPEIGINSASGAPAANAVDDTGLLSIMSQVPKMVGWVNWCQSHTLSSQKNSKALMADPRLINLSDLPKGITV